MTDSLEFIFDGWQAYQKSIVYAVKPLTPDQLVWRPAENLWSVGELVRHISMGRVVWFLRMGAPGSDKVAGKIEFWEQDSDGNRQIVEEKIDIADQPDELIHWLELTWEMIENTMKSWKLSGLSKSYQHVWNGQKYAPTRQWTIWRILSHDIHHGGELSLMLGLQGIEAFELSVLFGHTILPPVVKE